MADDTVTLPGTGADVAVDRIAGDDYQLIKLVDATEDSLERTGVDAHPLVAEARVAFVDYDDSIVPVTDNGLNHWLPVAVRNSVTVDVGTVSTSVPVVGAPSATALTGPSDGSWGSAENPGRSGMLMLAVKSTGGTPTVAAFGAASSPFTGGTFDQQLPLVVPDGDTLVLAETFTPGVGARFCYILAPPPWLEIRAVSGGTSAPVDAALTADAFQPPIVATVHSGAQPVTDNGGTLSVDDGGGSLTVDNAALSVTGGGTESGAQRVTIATDSTGVLSVDDNGGSLTVDGTVAATQSGTWNVGTVSTVTNVVHVDDNSSTLSVDDGGGSLTVDNAALSVTGGGTESGAQRVTIASDSTGLLPVVAHPTVTRQRQVSSGLSTGAGYAIGETAGTLYTFTGCARVSGGTGTLMSAVLLDKGDVGTDYRLHIYRASVSLSADNATWAVSDSDQESLIGILTMPSMLDVGANRVSTLANIGLPYDCAATSLFVGVETRTANGAYAAATDLNLILTYALD